MLCGEMRVCFYNIYANVPICCSVPYTHIIHINGPTAGQSKVHPAVGMHRLSLFRLPHAMLVDLLECAATAKDCVGSRFTVTASKTENGSTMEIGSAIRRL